MALLAGSSTTWPSLEAFTVDLSDRLRQVAHSRLADLEASIKRDGFDWLEDYIGNIEAQGARAPISELIKTPSRTQKSKRTRALTTATKNRTKQVKLFNERLALSPLANDYRLPLSPLQSRSFNVMSTMGPVSPSQGKAASFPLPPAIPPAPLPTAIPPVPLPTAISPVPLPTAISPVPLPTAISPVPPPPAIPPVPLREVRSSWLSQALGTRTVPVIKGHLSASTTGSSTDMLSASTSSKSHSTLIASKTAGIKPVPGPVKSLQNAAAAAKKEQEASERKAALREQIEQRRLEAAQRKADEERARREEERQRRVAELEEKRRRWAENEKHRKEREERMEKLSKEKALREEREAAAARAKQAEEEAARKRKMAPMLTKSTSSAQLKRIMPVKGKEPERDVPRVIKGLTASTANNPLPDTSVSSLASKLGPSSFRTVNSATVVSTPHDHHQTNGPRSTSTIDAVPSQQHPPSSANMPSSTISLVVPAADRRPLGPPFRTTHGTVSNLPGNASVHPSDGMGRSSAVLQQSRMTLQAQLDQKALDMASEEIVLPDIASEYSDSEDEDKETDFMRPAWAESPELKHALEMQARVNPDELFGPIRPISMGELFKASRPDKFRARTSSANWNGGDRLTEQEERDYARRMGFKPINAPKQSGSGDR